MNFATMTVNPWGSFAGLRDLQREMNRLFESSPKTVRPARFPLVNVFTDTNGATITAEIPGVDPADIDVSLVKGQLTIRGILKNTAPEGENVVTHLKERGCGEFSRSIGLPFEVQEDQISAKCEQGVLTVTLPRSEKTKPRSIPVTAN